MCVIQDSKLLARPAVYIKYNQFNVPGSVLLVQVRWALVLAVQILPGRVSFVIALMAIMRR